MNKFAMSIRVVRTAALLVLASVLIGCGGSKTVITADDSAEYRNAISLPPLKKPSVSSSAVDSAAQPSAPSSQPSVIETQSSDKLVSDSGTAAAIEARSASAKQPSAAGQKPISARVIELDGDIARLQIDAGLNSAWNYLSENLKRSDITVHTRSKTAMRFSIGCASLQAEPAGSAKRGSWSFFSNKEKSTEHCSLLLASGRSATQVKLLNRSGVEYASADSKALFARLLNN